MTTQSKWMPFAEAEALRLNMKRRELIMLLVHGYQKANIVSVVPNEVLKDFEDVADKQLPDTKAYRINYHIHTSIV